MLIRSLCLITCLSVVGCNPASIVRPKAPDEAQRAEVLVYREPAMNAAGIGMVFGADENDYVALNNTQYARLDVSPGSHTFFVRSTQADKPFSLTVELGANESKCLKAYANPTNMGKALLPFAYYMGNTFLLELTPCLTPEELAKYSPVVIEYQ